MLYFFFHCCQLALGKDLTNEFGLCCDSLGAVCYSVLVIWKKREKERKTSVCWVILATAWRYGQKSYSCEKGKRMPPSECAGYTDLHLITSHSNERPTHRFQPALA
jgi:hypothetical protein